MEIIAGMRALRERCSVVISIVVVALSNVVVVEADGGNSVSLVLKKMTVLSSSVAR